ncbi:phosphate transport system regulatory protein PhoU [candidate division WOR-3 bacterium JGI_Cruoil_03_44_89]|uniref:Phosphate-specific transport system accessory protein PhoU n=1 Tax=candidate division WOR-3 bacterium JGI_Cruoil_03_44_89 TaxID=1973748 RepID=A0A235BY19_UNCW3|nr:MAG: phosphate transport system regulatory protein PhoU [candidate division WOR-3 bacterium JGI_Cruoil_03_44_89]
MRHFDEEKELLRKRLLSMTGKVEESIKKAIKSLRDRDESIATKVVNADAEIDREEVDIEEKCIELIARYQPEAIDLRTIIGLIKINNDLERIGDLSVNIACASIRLLEKPQLKPIVGLSQMTGIVTGMLADSIKSFINGDVQLARSVCVRDNEADEMRNHLIRELLTYMMEDPKTISRCMDLALIARNLERIGDLSTNISEDVIYINEAVIIRHHRAL